jgi:hypothetical protein
VNFSAAVANAAAVVNHTTPPQQSLKFTAASQALPFPEGKLTNTPKAAGVISTASTTHCFCWLQPHN